MNERLASLDVFRGITIAAMILVNNPGTSPVYWPLDHAEWNGLTPTDWIFPFFLFIVGVSISISMGRRIAEGVTRSIYTKVFVRAATIYLLGLAISLVPFFQFGPTDAPDWLKLFIWLLMAAALFCLLIKKFAIAAGLAAASVTGMIVMNLAGYNVVPYNFGTMRIFGVLQRIAVCYLITSLIFIKTNWKQQVAISVVLLLGYWLVMTVIPVPGCDAPNISDKACNLAAYIDRLILTEDHIWRYGKVYDPEGMLSTIPAIVTTISGVLAGTWLMRRSKDQAADAAGSSMATGGFEKASGMFFFGTVLFAISWIWNSFFPFNKALWTSSYVLATSGLALLMLGCCYWLIDLKGYKKWAKPFLIFGSNALALFVFSGICARMLLSFTVTGPEGKPWSIHRWIVESLFLSLLQPINASLAYAICFILFWLFLMWILYRNKIFIKA